MMKELTNPQANQLQDLFITFHFYKDVCIVLFKKSHKTKQVAQRATIAHLTSHQNILNSSQVKDL